jgi:colanic acid/amylovoran biosynthesis protein
MKSRQLTSPETSEPDDVARLCGECRVVLTGSYHAAVFALAQGTPVVAIAASRYYEQKFFGLRDLFGTGCHVVEAGDELTGRLGTALESAWASSGDVTVALRTVARELVERSRQAYERLRALGAA